MTLDATAARFFARLSIMLAERGADGLMSLGDFNRAVSLAKAIARRSTYSVEEIFELAGV